MPLYDHIIPHVPGRYGSWLRTRRQKFHNRKPPEGFFEHLWSWVKTLVWALTVVTIVNGLAFGAFTVPTPSMENTVMAGEFLFVNKFKYGPSTPQIIPFLNLALPYYKTPPIWKPVQGDIIVFVYPGHRDQVKADNFEYYLKRCVAISGQTVEIRDAHVFVDNVEYPLPVAAPPRDRGAQVQYRLMTEGPRMYPPSKDTWNHENYGPLRIPAKGDVITLTQENIIDWTTFIMREGHAVNSQTLTVEGFAPGTYTVQRDYVFGMGDNRDNSEDSRFWGLIPEQDVVGTPMVVYWSWQNRVNNVEQGLMYKIMHIRWNRLGTIINK
ncbi:MAG: signal peptidase I [bacterium]|nr:signal peptidase I [bacterium]